MEIKIATQINESFIYQLQIDQKEVVHQPMQMLLGLVVWPSGLMIPTNH